MDDKTSTGVVTISGYDLSWMDMFRGLIIVAAIAVPLVLPDFQTALVIEIFLLAMFAMSLDLLMGYTGYVSFGHAAFFATSAYLTGLTLMHVTTSALVAISVGILSVAIIAVPIGYFSLKRTGIYFAMLTLAFSQVLHVLVVNDFMGLTGGSDGLTGLPRGNFAIPGIFDFVPTQMGYYYLLLTTFVVAYLLMRRIVNSPFGAVMVAIRENENRAKYAGYDVDRFKLIAFIASAMFGGLAGALYMPFYQVLSPDIFFWDFSGEAIVIVLVGGMGTLVGPVLGAFLFVGLREIVSPFLADWTMVLGVVFILFILFLPNGMISIRDFVIHHLDSEDDES
ncbi:branched-chain amino acid ABC transporter permease [Natronomonas gomsonensis]|uniref:branched-chain amino acid ABC transporter permease n=1 Tax=Natronomonas gomsonensis TaxID=1046043 RepID=UPI0020CA6D8C|nr:branched-chain amino acid ABC transporter permease [Natronomonas gomsonensis]MCY4729939.1 branched-chain amino acid ABC transporter permease [Natronomonas gomsonensis]